DPAGLLTPLACPQRTFARDGITVAASDCDVSGDALLDGVQLLRADASAASAAVFGDSQHDGRIDALCGTAALERREAECQRDFMLRFRQLEERSHQPIFDCR